MPIITNVMGINGVSNNAEYVFVAEKIASKVWSCRGPLLVAGSR